MMKYQDLYGCDCFRVLQHSVGQVEGFGDDQHGCVHQHGEVRVEEVGDAQHGCGDDLSLRQLASSDHLSLDGICLDDVTGKLQMLG